MGRGVLRAERATDAEIPGIGGGAVWRWLVVAAVPAQCRLARRSQGAAHRHGGAARRRLRHRPPGAVPRLYAGPPRPAGGDRRHGRLRRPHRRRGHGARPVRHPQRLQLRHRQDALRLRRAARPSLRLRRLARLPFRARRPCRQRHRQPRRCPRQAPGPDRHRFDRRPPGAAQGAGRPGHRPAGLFLVRPHRRRPGTGRHHAVHRRGRSRRRLVEPRRRCRVRLQLRRLHAHGVGRRAGRWTG